MTRSSSNACFLAAMTFIAVAGATPGLADEPSTEKTAAASAKLPPSVDLRPFFSRWGLALRVQGERNTCSLFAVCGAVEYAVGSKQNARPPLSVEFLNWAGNQTGKETLDGACFSELWKGVTAYGICPETEMPYQEYFEPTNKPSKEAIAHAKKLRDLGLQLHWIKEWDPEKGLTDQQLAAIKRTLRGAGRSAAGSFGRSGGSQNGTMAC